jgi:hypothetical protein
MGSNPISFSDLSGNYCMFYSAQAMSNHNSEKEFGTVIAESKNRLIIVDDEINRRHLYLIPKTKVDHYSSKQIYFNVPETSLEDFEM